MSLVGIVADDNVSWLQVSVDVALRVNALQTVHELESNDDYGLDIEFTLFK